MLLRTVITRGTHYSEPYREIHLIKFRIAEFMGDKSTLGDQGGCRGYLVYLREDTKNAGVIINVLIGTNGHMPYRDLRRELSQQFIMMCYFQGDFFPSLLHELVLFHASIN